MSKNHKTDGGIGSELFYNSDDNSLCEIVKSFANSAAVMRYDSHGAESYSVVTKPCFDGCYISWHLCFSDIKSRLEATELADRIDKNIATFAQSLELKFDVNPQSEMQSLESQRETLDTTQLGRKRGR